jgi:hypothetical protein
MTASGRVEQIDIALPHWERRNALSRQIFWHNDFAGGASTPAAAYLD